MKIKLAHNKRNVAILEVVIYALISIVYVFIIKDVYGYMGFTGDPKLVNILVGFLFLFFLLIIGSKIRDEFMFCVWHMMFILFGMGQIIYYQYDGVSIYPLLANTIFLIVIFLFSYVKWDFKLYYLSGKYIEIIIISSIIFFLPILVKYYSYVDMKSLLFVDVYDTRLFFRQFDDLYFGYIRAPLSRIILPSLLVIAIYKRKIWLVVLSGFMIIFIFLVGALKSVFIGMFAALLFYYGRDYLTKLYILIYLFLGLTVFGLIIFAISENTFLVNSFVRRILFIPPMLDSYYYEIFKNRPLFWSHNELGSLFIDYPLLKPPNMYVGEDILNKRGMSANVGIITEGYFSFHFIGVFLHSIILGFILIFLKRINIKPMFFGIVFVYIYYINTSFFTVLMLTHGFFFFMVYAYLFLNRNYE